MHRLRPAANRGGNAADESLLLTGTLPRRCGTTSQWIVRSPYQALGWEQSPTQIHNTATEGRLLQYLLGGYVFFLPVQFEAGVMNIAPSDLFLVLGLLMGLSRLRFASGAWSVFHPSLIFVFLIGTFLAFSNLGILTSYVFIKLVGLLLLFSSYLLVTSVARNWLTIRRILQTFVSAVVLNAILALAAYVSPRPVPGLNYGSERLSGTLIDPNAFGGIVMAALVIHGMTYRSTKPLIGGRMGALAGGILALALFLTLSRSAWMGMCLAILVSVMIRPRVLTSYAPLAVLTVVLALFVMSRKDSSRTLSLAERKNTAEQRITQIQEAIPLIEQYPILGTGIGGFDYATKSDPTKPHPYIIHNTTVWILTEFGMVGLTTFLGFIFWFFLRGVPAYRRAPTEEKALVVCLLAAHAGMFGVSAGIEALYQRHWWLVMALLGSILSIQRKATSTRVVRA